MHWAFYLIYLLLGCGIGCFSGLLGLGGGLIVVPILHLIFKSLPDTSSYNMHIAIATSLAVMIVTSITATVSHARRGSVLWSAFGWMAIGMLFGAIVGPFVSGEFATRTLEIIFGSIQILVALFIFFVKRKSGRSESKFTPFFRNSLYVLGGAVAAFIGSMLGIGGGVIIVPFLLFLGIRSQEAVGTSSAATMLTAIVGTGSLLMLSYHIYIPLSIGFIYLPAAIALSVGSLICTPLGVRLAHKLPERHLKKIFIFVLVAFGFIMIF